MNFQNLILRTLTLSMILSISAKTNLAMSEPSNNLKSNHYKLLETKPNFAYDQAIEHKLNQGIITTQFSPQDSQGNHLELTTLASKLGYDHFNWVSYVEVDPYGINDYQGKMMSAPYNDPPVGGYQYDRADKLPFYWDVENCDRCRERHHIQHHQNLHQFELTFKDAPTDSRLQPGESIEFMTSLVGVKSINSAQQQAAWDVLHTFRWKTTKTPTKQFQVSLVDSNVDTAQIPSSLLAHMILDGAKLSSSIKISASSN